ncbi:MAG: archaellin/type IV pilin N-terminal domain-containing protein [Candidatus Bathyarchaeia archaeon]|nr:flagellin [Candidatus Bathyarchaeota archaeon]
MRKAFFRNRRGMVGIEAAIVLIAFVIVAAAFSFMVINMGLFSTQRGKEAIQDSLQEAVSPLTVDGLILIKGKTGQGGGVSVIVIPLKTLGVKYVPMDADRTVVSFTISGSQDASYPNIYAGIDNTPIDSSTNYDGLASNVNPDEAKLFIVGSDDDYSLDATEKGYLIIKPSSTKPVERDHVIVEIRPQKGAPLSIEFTIPPQLPYDESWLAVGV